MHLFSTIKLLCTAVKALWEISKHQHSARETANLDANCCVMIGRFSFDRKMHHTASTSQSLAFVPSKFVCLCGNIVLCYSLPSTKFFFFRKKLLNSRQICSAAAPKYSNIPHCPVSLCFNLAVFCLQLAPLFHFGMFSLICNLQCLHQQLWPQLWFLFEKDVTLKRT